MAVQLYNPASNLSPTTYSTANADLVTVSAAVPGELAEDMKKKKNKNKI